MRIKNKIAGLRVHLQSFGYISSGLDNGAVIYDVKNRHHFIYVSPFLDNTVVFATSSDYAIKAMMSYAKSMHCTEHDLIFNINFSALSRHDIERSIENALNSSHTSLSELFYRSLLNDIKNTSRNSMSDLERLYFGLSQAQKMQERCSVKSTIGDIGSFSDSVKKRIEMLRANQRDPIGQIMRGEMCDVKSLPVEFGTLGIGQIFADEHDNVFMTIGQDNKLLFDLPNCVVLKGNFAIHRGRQLIKPAKELVFHLNTDAEI